MAEANEKAAETANTESSDKQIQQPKQKPKRAAQQPNPSKAAVSNADKPVKMAVFSGRPGDVLLFNRYSYDVEVSDPSLRNYINLKQLAYPSTYRRASGKSFSKAQLNIVERLNNMLMRGGTGGKVGGHIIRTKGRLQGKKLKTMHIIEGAFEMISSRTNTNPLQVLVRALENSAPIEDTTRVIYGGIKSNVAVDISASRRLDIALRNIAMATIISAFGSKKTIAEALANELVLAANMDINSYAIKRKNEIERMARSAK